MNKVNLITLRVGLLVMLLGCFAWQPSNQAQDTKVNRLTKSEREDGWKLLFNGKNLNRWRNYKKESLGDGWQIKDDAIVWVKQGAGDIVTKKQYDSFELILEYKISKGGNSGLMYHVLETESAPWQTGPEIQIQDNVDGHDPQKAGWLYQLYPASSDATKPVGEWNQLRVLITPERCEQYMNGVKYCEYVKGSEDWNKQVEKSKFKVYKDFGKPTKGHICLQDHGNEVAFRNIKIREIK
ncbi:MAG: 3-keto-disaccharide hydrolase [Limisphaerales bacterium]|jgi:hypothetical protein|nr:DUF1080 domain-containing protein [Verrucomicrobiota bacterium]